MAVVRKDWNILVVVRYPSVAEMVPGSSVSAMGSGKIASNSDWLLMKLAGPMKVKTGFAPGVKRRSSLEMVAGVVEAAHDCKGIPLNRSRALTGVWELWGSASTRMVSAA